MAVSRAITASAAVIGPELSPVSPAAIVLNGTRIEAAGSLEDVGALPQRVVHESGLTLLPGFIDAHVHIGLAPPGLVLRGGVTTVRDLGWSPDEIFALARASVSGDFDGPLIVAAGPMLTAPGGYPTRAGWAPTGTGREVSSDVDAVAAVDEICARGAAVVKVALNPPVGPSLDARTLTAITHAAHERGRRVTGHIWGLSELAKAIDSGVDELAHMLMSSEVIPDETIDRLVVREVTIVPTLSIRYRRDRTLAVDNLRRFARAGGRIVYGTDLGNAGPLPGIDRREIKALADAGLSGRGVVAAATVEAAAWLGLQRKGVIAPGFDADIVGVTGDPLKDPMDCARVAAVWRLGRRVR